MKRICIECGSELGLSELCGVCGYELACFAPTLPKRAPSRPNHTEEQKNRFLADQKALARKNGLSLNWATYRYRLMFGEDPPVALRVA